MLSELGTSEVNLLKIDLGKLKVALDENDINKAMTQSVKETFDRADWWAVQGQEKAMEVAPTVVVIGLVFAGVSLFRGLSSVVTSHPWVSLGAKRTLGYMALGVGTIPLVWLVRGAIDFRAAQLREEACYELFEKYLEIGEHCLMDQSQEKALEKFFEDRLDPRQHTSISFAAHTFARALTEGVMSPVGTEEPELLEADWGRLEKLAERHETSESPLLLCNLFKGAVTRKGLLLHERAHWWGMSGGTRVMVPTVALCLFGVLGVATIGARAFISKGLSRRGKLALAVSSAMVASPLAGYGLIASQVVRLDRAKGDEFMEKAKELGQARHEDWTELNENGINFIASNLYENNEASQKGFKAALRGEE